MDNNSQFEVYFHTALYDESGSGLEDGDLVVIEMHGSEEISRIYEYEIVVRLKTAHVLDFDVIDKLMAKDCYLSFGPDREHKIQGVLRAVESVSEEHNLQGEYRLEFVPRLWRLSQTLESSVYQDKNSVDIVEDILKEYGLEKDTDYEIRVPDLKSKFPKRDYTVQFMETELDFISRLLEHDGLFFFFEHGEEKEKFIIASTNDSFADITDQPSFVYDSTVGNGADREFVRSLHRKKAIVPKKVHVWDYNWKTPTTGVLGDVMVDADHGIGEQFFYGEHVKNSAEAKRLATMRADELRMRNEVYNGHSNVRGLHPGVKFDLEQHPNSAMDQSYVVTSVFHSASQAPNSDSGGTQGSGYSNSFRGILNDSKAPYRPARITPKPRIGIIHAHIDQIAGAEDVPEAPIDDLGRYRVVLPFNNSDAGTGKASRWVRMAQSYTGDNYGIHFPLHVGAEVILGHIDGDPDRPIIIGSVPHNGTNSPVTNEDATRSRIVTRSNLRVVFKDKA